MPAGWWIEVDNVVVVAQPFALVFLRILRLLEHLVDARLNGILLALPTLASERAVVEVTEREQVLKETLIYVGWCNIYFVFSMYRTAIRDRATAALDQHHQCKERQCQ